MMPSLSLWLGRCSKRLWSNETRLTIDPSRLAFGRFHRHSYYERIRVTVAIQWKDIRVRADGSSFRMQVRTRSHAKRRCVVQGLRARTVFCLEISRVGPYAVTSSPVPFARTVPRMHHLAAHNRMW